MDVKTADKIWVVVNNKTLSSYVSIMDNGHKSRLKTARAWSSRCKDVSEYEFDNTPTSGIKIVGYKSRYRTDNKVIEVLDPRGFKCEIYIDNLVNIIDNVTIVNGVIEEKLTWGRLCGNNYLINSSEELVKDSDFTKFSKIEEGQYYKVDGSLRKMLGKFDIEINYDVFGTSVQSKSNGFWSRYTLKPKQKISGNTEVSRLVISLEGTNSGARIIKNKTSKAVLCGTTKGELDNLSLVDLTHKSNFKWIVEDIIRKKYEQYVPIIFRCLGENQESIVTSSIRYDKMIVVNSVTLTKVN